MSAGSNVVAFRPAPRKRIWIEVDEELWNSFMQTCREIAAVEAMSDAERRARP